MPATDTVNYLPGLRAYTTPRGIRVIELDYWANPTHNAAWAGQQRPLYATNREWRREMERDWTTPGGDPYFPTFSAIGREMYVHVQTQFVDQWPVYRAYDFGRRRPAAIWFQYSPKQDRVVAYREFMPHNIGSHQFRDAVKHLSNELVYASLGDEAKRWVDEYAMRPTGSHCPPPWFPLSTRYLDFAGHEANQQQSNAPKPEDAVVKDIFAAGGIYLNIITPRVLGRNHLIDRMLELREDGWPGIFIDPQMEESIVGFEGAWAYPEKTKAVPVPTKPRNDGHYINLLDAWGYGVSAVVPDDRQLEPPLREITRMVGGRPQILKVPRSEEPNWQEVRPR